MRTFTLAHPTSLGDVIPHAGYGEDGELTALEVLRADPRVLIGGRFLRELVRGESHLRTPRASCDRAEVGGVFRIDADNQILVYVLTEFEPRLEGLRVKDAFAAEWPD